MNDRITANNSPTKNSATKNSATPTLLIVDDERDLREPLAKYLSSVGYRTLTASDGVEAIDTITKDSASLKNNSSAKGVNSSKSPVSIVLTDVRMPRMSGIDLLKNLRKTHPEISVFVFTAYGTVEMAVEAIRSGAVDYVLKPVIFEDIRNKIESHIKRSQLENSQSTDGVSAIIGASPQIESLKELILQVAGAGTMAVIQGESGSGKELIARALHFESQRRDGPFIAVNCAAVPEQLLESEFFGHVKGAFTGAISDKKGFFELAQDGTLLLDEIADLPLAMQAKLLRALESREVFPVGGGTPVLLNARVIAATGRPLEKAVEEGSFRSDLYYRIAVIEIDAPPLRDRRGDIPELLAHFLDRLKERGETQVNDFSPEAVTALSGYSWPGNVRELRNIVERSVILSKSDRVELSDLPEHVIEAGGGAESVAGNLRDARRTFERDMILKTIASCDNDKKLAANLLGIGLSSLYRKMEELGIE